MVFNLQGTFVLALFSSVRTTPDNNHTKIVISTTQQTETCQNEEKWNPVKTQISQMEKMLENERQLNEQLRFQLLQTQKIIENERKLTEQMEKRLEFKIQEVAEINKNISFPKNCKEILKRRNYVTGIYIIKPGSQSFTVLCEMNLRGGGWTVFHNRFDGSQEFNLLWKDYKNGFGTFLGEFWLGLDHLHELTSQENNEILIELTDLDGKVVYAHYFLFRVGNENEGYALNHNLSGFSGDAGDSLSYHVGMKFSTKDRDQDKLNTLNCADRFTGAWWHNACLNSNLNGRYLKSKNLTGEDVYSGMCWKAFHEGEYSLLKARMMVRPQ